MSLFFCLIASFDFEFLQRLLKNDLRWIRISKLFCGGNFNVSWPFFSKPLHRRLHRGREFFENVINSLRVCFSVWLIDDVQSPLKSASVYRVILTPLQAVLHSIETQFCFEFFLPSLRNHHDVHNHVLSDTNYRFECSARYTTLSKKWSYIPISTTNYSLKRIVLWLCDI